MTLRNKSYFSLLSWNVSFTSMRWDRSRHHSVLLFSLEYHHHHHHHQLAQSIRFLDAMFHYSKTKLNCINAMSVPLSHKIYDELKEYVIFLSFVLKRFLHFHEIGPGIIQCYYFHWSITTTTTTTTTIWSTHTHTHTNKQQQQQQLTFKLDYVKY